ncbi:aromatic ring-opening dioxygenase LigA [Flaviflexus huanghaiensis]|uniref:aromatic ring-opening dioxygenase LigA n=1 Tax=Flaviflexus huanghaiensis TaxID=1111473 RepID=UPI0015FB29BC|nr:aromatic ring-opening dioxygenase LigA [Flaviflexus huanghaiensis]
MNTKLAKITGIVTLIFGVLFIGTGATAWFLVADQLKAENITVSEDADLAAGNQVAGPISAYAQAQVIQKHALAITDGETYATLGDLARAAEEAGDEDLATEYSEKRTTMMNASFLRSSLFTSVLSFGVALFAIGVGVWMLLAGATFLSTSRTNEEIAAGRRTDTY